MRVPHGVFPRPDGAYDVRLELGEREILRGLAEELERLVSSQDDTVARLFPAAYKDDPEAEEDYRSLIGGTLVSGRLEGARALQAGAASERVDHAEAEVWCGALNDLRLVLGERLGVTEELYERGIDPDDPNAFELSIYGWLTWLQASLVDALASRLA